MKRLAVTAEFALGQLLYFIDAEIAKLEACLELSNVRGPQVLARIAELRLVRLKATAKDPSP
jgi:hypothetical protein